MESNPSVGEHSVSAEVGDAQTQPLTNSLAWTCVNAYDRSPIFHFTCPGFLGGGAPFRDHTACS